MILALLLSAFAVSAQAAEWTIPYIEAGEAVQVQSASEGLGTVIIGDRAMWLPPFGRVVILAPDANALVLTVTVPALVWTNRGLAHIPAQSGGVQRCMVFQIDESSDLDIANRSDSQLELVIEVFRGPDRIAAISGGLRGATGFRFSPATFFNLPAGEFMLRLRSAARWFHASATRTVLFQHQYAGGVPCED